MWTNLPAIYSSLLNSGEQFLPGIITALTLFSLTLVFAIPLGIITALARLSGHTWMAKTIQIYIWIARGTPLMLQLIFIYFGAGALGIPIDRFLAAVVTFTLNYAAYYAEIFRSGIQSIEISQFEAAQVLGSRYYQTIWQIILPQATKRVVPSISNEVINLIKDTSLAQVIGVMEIFSMVKITAARDFVIYPFLIATIFYLIMTYIFTRFFNYLEGRL